MERQIAMESLAEGVCVLLDHPKRVAKVIEMGAAPVADRKTQMVTNQPFAKVMVTLPWKVIGKHVTKADAQRAEKIRAALPESSRVWGEIWKSKPHNPVRSNVRDFGKALVPDESKWEIITVCDEEVSLDGHGRTENVKYTSKLKGQRIRGVILPKSQVPNSLWETGDAEENGKTAKAASA